METTLINHLGHKRYLPASLTEIQEQLDLSKKDKPLLQRSMRALEKRGIAFRLKGDRYISKASPSLIPGRIQITKSGRGFVTPDDSSIPEISISSRDTGTALNEDRVLALCARGAESKSLSGSVVSILERRRTRFVGTLKHTPKGIRVMPDDPRFGCGISIRQSKNQVRARLGDKVVVELIRWDSRNSDPQGKITEVLGAPDSTGVDMLGVLRQYDLKQEFPPKVVKEARSFGRKVTAADLKNRRDCREHLVVTIDPDDARDFDDAICLKKVGGNRWKLWVHIADVSHYVQPGSALDAEAKRRGNSSYLVDRVIPMLPEELSNELCSLKPRVDRLTKCVEFLLSEDGKVLGKDFYPAVIHSQKRLTYAQALKVLENPAEDAIGEMLHAAGSLAMKIRKRRFEAGSLDLEFAETKIRLDAEGRVERIEQLENDISHQLIEEFMLLANEAVAGRLMKLKRPAIYRTHEAPDPERLRAYQEEVLSHKIPCGNLSKPAEVQKLFRRLDDHVAGAALKIGFLKSLNRACYTSDPLGHYGLAKEKYTHFTSPIRRYSDLVVHRSLFAGSKNRSDLALNDVADHLSATERNSADAERDSKDVKLYAYLLEQLESGNSISYRARVTSLREFGFFVDIPSLGISGMVPLALMNDDHYTFFPKTNQIRGQRGRIIRIGDELDVEIAKADLASKMLDFRICGTDRRTARNRSTQRKRRIPRKKAAEGARRRRSLKRAPGK